MCLTSSIRKAKCLSAMHVPNDDECVISDQNQVTESTKNRKKWREIQMTKPDLFIENDTPGTFTVNFFRNICVDPPDSEGQFWRKTWIFRIGKLIFKKETEVNWMKTWKCFLKIEIFRQKKVFFSEKSDFHKEKKNNKIFNFKMIRIIIFNKILINRFGIKNQNWKKFLLTKKLGNSNIFWRRKNDEILRNQSQFQKKKPEKISISFEFKNFFRIKKKINE